MPDTVESGREGPAQDAVAGIETARRLAQDEAIHWDMEADVLVVGLGGAGVCAAIQALEDGASVIALERFGGGGSTAVNGGIFYAGGGTAAQREAGVDDSAEEMFAYLREETQGVVSDDVLRRFCAGSAADAEWMTHHGVRFSGKLYPGKTSYPHTSYYLYHSDSSLAAPYRHLARPAARGHRAFLPPTKSAEGYGAGLYFPLEASAERLGATVLRRTEVARLIVDASGAVVGVEADHMPPDGRDSEAYAKLVRRSEFWTRLLPPAYPGATLTRARGARLMRRADAIERRARRRISVRARGGVILSTGGFIYNRQMIADHAPAYIKGMPQGTAGDTGAGMLLGQSVGGDVDRLDHCSAWRFLNPPSAWARGMLVDATGARFVNETHYGAAIGSAMVEGHAGVGWLILDAALVKAARAQVRHPEILAFQRYPAMLAMRFGRKKAGTLDALARKMGFDPAIFAQTVAEYNSAARGQGRDPYGKEGDELHAFEQGPFYAVDQSITAKYAPLPCMTLGGLKVAEDSGQVLRGDGSAVKGLFAAGRTAIGLCSNLYVSGLAVADCVFSGRRAGRHAAARQTG
ncbi:3-oxo-5alpha-steroid 4-dehydrogenase [Sphingobium sp. OAS761]|uniref:FAD-binding protein n=1 Tax=Sphingobium sp. OAS761 TaxID=2817901 RepID=UPI0020A06E94|nr:FAD-binding protein [Sphingobium sp. OAS761]MCP1471779.1 3-oxo-5alpha-steroid 4-dehydrogenase [Sphingobium sp. OAS761]